MKHRHLNHQDFTLAAIDDCIGRGRVKDWAELRRAVLNDPALMAKVKRICQTYMKDPYAQRYQFWMRYVEKHSA